ncbi:putative E3 ubiquitin-protein ligase UBR7 [Procambarus clarkii]|uniref:putative E3 ubiquitin-protein ligase UBR7 n=1 Tax=Procambarus clarkii TaxID=6728 RepID=UPI001E6773A9|nr:putative E3 ubiquitin-protein ligase UBR7 [Procambarus clarkii]
MAHLPSAEDGEEPGISMVELLEAQEERQLDAAAVLGAADDTSCTYDQGYVKRQALYACMTCCPADGGKLAGVCLACSYHCHEDHDLIELYTKRKFRCDCGNSKFTQNICKLLKEKLPENPENEYNHNFRGAYCTCHRPYPDPEDSIEDEMIQCCICEDWYHGRHQGSNVPPGDDYAEMICGECLPKHKLLAYYMGYAVTTVKAEDSKDAVDVEKSSGKTAHEEEKVEPRHTEDCSDETDFKVKEKTLSINTEEPKEKDEVVKVNGAVENKLSGCKLDVLKKQELPSGAVFLPDQWRKQLCTCEACKAKYKNEGILFLLDDEDTVAFYEESGKSHHQSHSAAPAQRELEALSSLDRVTRTEMVHEYNTLSSSLRDYLRKFAENKKVVRDEDIREFFSQLEANKKKRPGSSIQLFCK